MKKKAIIKEECSFAMNFVILVFCILLYIMFLLWLYTLISKLMSCLLYA